MPGLAPCVSETVTVNGTGTITLSGTAAGTGLQTFASGFAATATSNVQYKILGTVSGAWETGLGTYNGGAPGTLTRSFINSSTGSAINFSSEICTVSCDIIADANGNVPAPGLAIGAYSNTTNSGLTGPSSTTTQMQGLAALITPKKSGVVLVNMVFTIIGASAGAVANQGITYQGYYGTGSVPANNSALTGTAMGLAQTWKLNAGVTAYTDISEPRAFNFIVSGLTLGTAIWVDIAAAYIGGAHYQLTNVIITLIEI